MTRIILSILLLLSISLSANQVNEKSIQYKKACDNGSMNGCINLGILYFTGEGVKQNPKKAKKLFVRACKKRYLKACHYLGAIYKRGADGIDRDIKRAKNFYVYSCKRGYRKSCEQYDLIREKPEIKGSGKNVTNSGYTYSPQIYGG